MKLKKMNIEMNLDAKELEMLRDIMISVKSGLKHGDFAESEVNFAEKFLAESQL